MVIFAGAPEAGAILGWEDDYVRATRPLERMAKLRRAQPVDAAEYRRHMAAQALDWTEEERRRLAPLAERVERFVETLRARMPARILLAKAADVMDGTPHTRVNAIVLPRAFLASARQGDLAYVIGHELFHLLSRHDERAREQLYAAIGFRPCQRTELPAALERLRITNPDAPEDRHTIRVRHRGQAVEAMPVSMLNSGKLDPARGFLGRMRTSWLLIERRDDVCRATGRSVEAQELEGLFGQVGRNTGTLIHPEEILADNFAALAIVSLAGRHVPLPSPDVAERIRAILF